VVWYPTVDDVICTNNEVLDLTGDKHPHKLLGSREGVQAVIDKVRQAENQGLTTQAAMFMKEFAYLQLFAGGNHRTGYMVAKIFLLRNNKRLRVDGLNLAYTFIKNVDTRGISEIQRWIEHGEETLSR